MAQFEILDIDFTPTGSGPAELQVVIDNPQRMQLSTDPYHDPVPGNVEVVPPGQSPVQKFWVHAENHQLCIALIAGSGNDPLIVSNTAYFDQGDDLRLVDITIAELTENGTKARRIRRDGEEVCP